MEFPEVGDVVTTEQAVKLCKHFHLYYLVRRIEAAPDKYKSWKFDGCSALPDKILGVFLGCNWRDITYKCALPHDLAYAYGTPGDDRERMVADRRLYFNLITKAGMPRWCAAAFFEAVRIGGSEVFGLSFSWGFALK